MACHFSLSIPIRRSGRKERILGREVGSRFEEAVLGDVEDWIVRDGERERGREGEGRTCNAGYRGLSLSSSGQLGRSNSGHGASDSVGRGVGAMEWLF